MVEARPTVAAEHNIRQRCNHAACAGLPEVDRADQCLTSDIFFPTGSAAIWVNQGSRHKGVGRTAWVREAPGSVISK